MLEPDLFCPVWGCAAGGLSKSLPPTITAQIKICMTSWIVAGVGAILIPLSTLAAPGSTALAPGVEAALQAWASGYRQPGPALGHPVAALGQSAPALVPALAPAPAAATLAALVPHLPQVSPPVASAMLQRLAYTGYRGAVPSSPDKAPMQSPMQAAAPLVEAQTAETPLAGQGTSVEEAGPSGVHTTCLNTQYNAVGALSYRSCTNNVCCMLVDACECDTK